MDVEKFHADRPTDFGETSAVKHKTAGNYRSGGLIKNVNEKIYRGSATGIDLRAWMKRVYISGVIKTYQS